MGPPLNNITAPDAFDETGTLRCPGTVEVRLFVNNQAIYWRRGVVGESATGIQWRDEEEFLPPGVWPVPDVCDAIQVRAAVPAAELPEGKRPAQVTIWTRTRAELAA